MDLNTKPIVKIIGFGFVGKAVQKLFPDALLHNPSRGLVSDEKADVAFVCVPTPLKDNKLDCSIVEKVVREAKENLIIIRSAVMPRTCDKLVKDTGKLIVYQPEYIGETIQHPLLDEKATPFLILGGEPKARLKAIYLYETVYNANVRLRQVSAYEAEVIKLSENRAIAFKIAQCQELYDACEKAGIDYYTVRDAVYGDDPRFNLWWTFVYPNKRGFNSKCLPKDVYGWAAWAESVGYDPKLTRKMLEVNDEYLK
jgi:UDPglucose 6-dehydrogenase